MANDMIHIVCNIDNNYVKHCCAMLSSLFSNNKEKFHIHIITDNLNENLRNKLQTFVEDEFKNQLSIYSVGQELINKCPESHCSHITVAGFYRCFVADLLHQSISKVLFLDCDLIVNGSIIDLWNTDISNYAVGVVEDQWSSITEYYTRLDIPETYSYFNSGVMLINLDYWRKYNIGAAVLEYVKMYPERLRFDDQDVLNALLHKQRLFIPHRWNYQDGFFRRKRKCRQESMSAIDKEMSHAVIIHFTGGKKPWNPKCMHPLKNLYFKYLDLTSWKGERPKIKLSIRINKPFLKIQSYLGLKNGYRKVRR